MAGIALNNARLGAVHGLAHPIGYRYHLAHGLVCGVLLPYVMEYNLLTAEDKYARIARELDLATAQDSAAMAAGELLHFIKVLRSKLKLPDRLGEVGLQVGDIPSLAEDSLTSGSLAANPKPAGYHDLVAILEANI
jgi:alcohol dehydrogenase class IV